MRAAFLLCPAVLLGLSLAAGSSGCSSTLAKAPSIDGSSRDLAPSTDGTPSADGSQLGRSYPCTGGFIGTLDAGVVPLPADAGASPPVNCVVGQSYCKVDSADKSVGVKPQYECRTVETFVDGGIVSVGLGVCSGTPTCACLCANGAFCLTECSCHDDGGFVIISCFQV